MKKLLLICLTALLPLSMWAFSYEGITYSVVSSTEMTCKVGYNYAINGEIIIPSIAYNGETGYTVVGIGDYAFESCTKMTSISIPETVTYVEEEAFNGCSGLTSTYSLNPNPPTCGSYAFYMVPSSCILYVPKGSKDAYASATEWGTSFRNIEEIDSGSSLEEGDVFEYEGINYRVTSVADYTVETTYSGESSGTATTYAGDIVIPETVEYDDMVFTVTGIGDYTFYNGKENITSVEIPETVTYIGDNAFYYCSKLTGTLTIPSNITYVGYLAYSRCGITSIVIESGDEPLYFDSYYTAGTSDNGNFGGCPLQNLYLDRNLEFDDGQLAPWSWISTLTEVTIGENMTRIPARMCYGLRGLEKIEIPDNITEMGKHAYCSCSGATELTISKKLQTIPDYAFNNCSNLEKIIIPDNITEIGEEAFYATFATSVSLSKNLTTIGDRAFTANNFSRINLPKSVTTIGVYAFSNNEDLEEVFSLNPDPPTCGKSVFAYTNDDLVLHVPNGSIEAYSSADVWKDFYEIHGLSEPDVQTLDATYITRTTATLNGTVEFLTEDKDNITEQGFEYWIDEDDVMIAKATDTDINGEDMSVLIQDLVENKNYTYRAYAKTENDTYYGGDFVFSTSNRNGDFCVDGIYYNYGTVEGTCVVTYRDENYNYYSGVMDIPESVLYNNTNYTVVGVGTWAFYQSPELIEVTIPNTVTSVANQAFNGCNALEKATIGSSVETIGSVSFSCPSLLELISLNPIPPTCNANAFEQVDKSACVLTVPEGSEEAYAAADVWKDFFPTDDDTTGIDSILVGSEKVEGIYTTSGQKLNTTVKGVNIIRYTDGTTKKVLVK